MQGFPHLKVGNTKVALIQDGVQVSYEQLNKSINQFATGLLADNQDLQEERIAFLMPASVNYVVTMFGIWRAGGIAVPLNTGSTIPEWEHVLSCASVSQMILDPSYLENNVTDEFKQQFLELCSSLDIQVRNIDDCKIDSNDFTLPKIDLDRRAMILFTSGTTNKPKGVVTTHSIIHSQITTLIEAWAWVQEDVIPLFLPMHHVHGIINVLCCGLWAGATVDVFAKFEMDNILTGVGNGDYTVFMAVPTVYVKMIKHFDSLAEDDVVKICQGFTDMRLNISGSAACPVPVFTRWQELTQQVLLERYGMTEIGMAISNPYDGERRAGAVGIPLPGVEVALFAEDHQLIEGEEQPGEIRIKSPNVFLEYWQNPEATEKTFYDGWFCTGDVAVLEQGYYRIMGRASIDIIKSGGYKLSALEIEGYLLSHPAIAECAVVGIEDETWGEAVSAFVVLKDNQVLDYDALKTWCKDKMSAYKIPKHLNLVDALPRNAMGKVTKTALK